MSAHENLEQAEHVEHASHGGNKKIAVRIAVLALFLSLSEMGGKSAQTEAVVNNVQSNDLWSFFQAKTIRTTVLRIAEWKNNIARYDDDPKSNEGRKQLIARAQESEHKRDELLARYHNFEMASAAFQIGIVLASARVITSIVALGWLSGLVGMAGPGFFALALGAPPAT